MQIRVVRLSSRHPLATAALALLLVAVVLLVLAFGVTLLAGGAVLGGVALLVRRALRLGRPAAPRLDGGERMERLDPSREVFVTRDVTRDVPRDVPRLPPADPSSRPTD